ncbi:YhbD family protein [Paenibacillus sp. GCM10012306]|uniref:YhbD family protein n=1 Tax=Paenibacillus sp. GCM10012306 TaxID=3317342 RepID=UPI00360AD430
MEEDLISKKDLLDLTGISYGQLYRWKRKQLIPEEWFIRKSTFTGQETFFPRKMILARIDNIVSMKDDLSLDELADKLSSPPPISKAAVSAKELLERNIVSSLVLDRFGKQPKAEGNYTFDEVMYLFTVDSLLSRGEMSLEEGDLLFRTLLENSSRLEGKAWELFFVRKMGVTSFLLSIAPAELIFDEGVRLVNRITVANLMEQLRGKLN